MSELERLDCPACKADFSLDYESMEHMVFFCEVCGARFEVQSDCDVNDSGDFKDTSRPGKGLPYVAGYAPAPPKADTPAYIAEQDQLSKARATFEDILLKGITLNETISVRTMVGVNGDPFFQLYYTDAEHRTMLLSASALGDLAAYGSKVVKLFAEKKS